MPLRSTVSSLASTEATPAAAPATTPAAAPRLARRPGLYKPPAESVDLTTGPGTDDDLPFGGADTAAPAELPAAPKVRKARKPRAPKAVVDAPSDDLKATRKLLTGVEADILELRAQIQKAAARYQPKLDKLLARHAELSAFLAQHLGQ